MANGFPAVKMVRLTAVIGKGQIRMDAFNDMLFKWQTFYFTMGGVSATLAGLMFVALSLAQHLINEHTRDQMRIFATPSMIYFVSVLLIAGVMLIPIMTPGVLAVLAVLSGAVGTIRAFRLAVQLAEAARRNGDFTLEDWLSQVIGPVAGYVCLLLAAPALLLDQWTLALIAILCATLILLLSAIGNTWSLVIWIVDQGKP
ncbi:MAG: hypothetical protein GC204_14485 [Chloroflexi bacterium]|nr:hypothetical protein [Chloroflexota bacterium]